MPDALPLRELQLYVQGEPHLVVLVSTGFDGVPWLERIRQAEALWDAAATGVDAEVHCYTPAELERKRASLPRVRAAVDSGVNVLAVCDEAD